MLQRMPNLLTVALVVLICAVFLGPFGDLDYSWQIRTGQRIVETGQLRIADDFSYTIAGQLLPDFEWLWEVALYKVWLHFGYVGLKLLKLACAFAPLVIVSRQLRQRGVGWPGVLVALLLAIAVLAPNWNLRPLTCTTIGLLLVSGWLHDHCHGRKVIDWRLPAVMLVWANCHPGVITGQALLLGAVGWEWLNANLRWNPPINRPALKRLTIVAGIGLLATFVSPDPVERILYPFRTRLDDPIWRVFVEMQPAYQFILRPPFTIAIAYCFAAMVAVSVVIRIRHFRLWEIALLAGAGGLANMAVRSLPDWFLLMLSIGLPQLMHMMRLSSDSGHSRVVNKWRELAGSPAFAFQPAYVAGVIALLVGLMGIPEARQQLLRIDVAQNPVTAADWMAANRISGRVFGSADYGSYLGWRLGDQVKCFVDTRGFFFPPHILADAQFLPAMTDDWPERLDRVLAAGTEYLLLETTGPRSALWRAMSPHLQPIYCDRQTVLLTAQQVVEGQQKYAAGTSVTSSTVTQQTSAAPDAR